MNRLAANACGFLLLFASGAPAVALAQAPVVSRVEIRGASDPLLLRHLTVQVGEPRDPETVRASVLLLSAMDLFDEVSVETEPEPDGTEGLVFLVKETPRLGTLKFSDAPTEPGLWKDLRRASGLHPDDPLRDQALMDASSRMMEWLRQNGYPRASVELEPLPSRPGSRGAFVRDVGVRLSGIVRETLVSSRIDGWPAALPKPVSPARAGEALTEETLSARKESLLAILRRSAYYRAQVKTDSVAGDLVFFVSPGPLFELNLDALPEKERVRTRERFVREGLTQEAIEEAISTVESEYLKRGHRDVEVDFQEVGTLGKTTGEFVVRPGPAWVVAAVQYRTDGVPSAPRSAGLPVGVAWVDADIEAERARLRAALIERGHAAAVVTSEVSGDPGSARVTFNAVPGPASTVASVMIEGAPPPAGQSRGAVTELATRANSAYRNADVSRDRTALLASLRDDGYVDARVEATTDYSDDRRGVAVVFHVVPGTRVRVGRILVVGLHDTRETVVLRESRLKPGDFLSYQKLLDTQSGLSATGLFSSVQIREFAAAPDERHLIIEVTEGVRTTIVPGLGFAETERLRASVELTKLNVSGLGRTASLFLRGSIRGSRALVSMNEPYAFGRRQAVNVQVYRDDDRSRDAFDFRRLGFQTQTIFPLRAGNILAQYTFQKTTTSNVAQDCAEVNRALCDSKVSGPSLGFVHDTRNDAIDPRRGVLYSVETLLSLDALGGDSFLKTTAFVARYDELRAGFVLAGSARLGLSRAFGSTAELPLPERFFAGGPSLMRGFRIDEVGPGRFSDTAVFIPEGGNALVAAALEARIDVSPYWGFQVFAETGSVFSRASSVRLGDLREVAGVGLRYRSPFGPLRLDWGFKLDRRPGESLQQLHIGVGYAF